MIEWTERGKIYNARCVPPAPEFYKIKADVTTIREIYGYPHWECKKALTNAEGDLAAAIEALKEDARDPARQAVA